MCTITLLKQNEGLRLFMNRDEAYSREIAQPPRLLAKDWGVFGPRDPQGGGTWIAHNKNGYWGCLLNGYFEQPFELSASASTPFSTSRGWILPELLSTEDPIRSAENFDASNYASFKLLIGNSEQFKLHLWDGRNYQKTEFQYQYLDKGYFLTSSSWQKNQVTESRALLFKNWCESKSEQLDKKVEIPDYHLGSDLPPEISPFMRRPEAGTQSVTSLWITDQKIEMDYLDTSKGALAEQAVSSKTYKSPNTPVSSSVPKASCA